MEQEREDYSDSPKAQPLSPERVHAGCAVAAILYPFACIFLMGLTWRWFVGTPLDRLVFNAGFVPAVSICTLVLLRLGGLRLHWGAVALFAAWAAIIGLLEGLLIVGIYASV